MSGELRQYKPSKLICSFSLLAPIPGFDANDIDLRPGLVRAPHIDGGRVANVWELDKDADNNGLYVHNQNTAGTLGFTYRQDAITNRYLSIMMNADEATQLAIGTIKVKDLQGTTLCIGRGARLQGHPRITFGSGVSQRVWMFLINDLVQFVGDHEKVG